jgi:hypothetical protein
MVFPGGITLRQANPGSTSPLVLKTALTKYQPEFGDQFAHLQRTGVLNETVTSWCALQLASLVRGPQPAT